MSKNKKEIVDFLIGAGYSVINHGTNDIESVDYPDLIHPVAKDVSNGKSSLGVIICGSGNGPEGWEKLKGRCCLFYGTMVS